MFADKKARRVGDIVTIVIQENNGATRNNNTTTAKQTAVDASIASFFTAPAASGLLTKGGAVPGDEFHRQEHLSPAAARSTMPKPSPPKSPCE